MSVRNSSELGINLVKIATKLTSNQRLLRLLEYTSNSPFAQVIKKGAEDISQPDISASKALHERIRVVPLVNEKEDSTKSTLVLIYGAGKVQDNAEFKALSFDVLVYVPLSEWRLNDINLRPFLIMSEIEKELKGKRIESLGPIIYQGFDLELVTDIMSCYRMEFTIDVFD
jgi:hypothetical protein